MKVKICGITDVTTGIQAAEYGADAIGFVFAESKRKVSEERAREIASHIPSEVYKVGVFVNETLPEIERIASIVGLTHIQLHGDETAEFCQSLSYPVIKAVSFQGNEQLASIGTYPADYILLDSPKGEYRGGNGKVFDWHQVDKNLLNNKKVILAGGLHEENVESAIEIIKPLMIDVSSGVETNGVKDLNKIKAFIEKAKGIAIGGEIK
ncbi:phosphoribosylanthranilate isomerase [Neobacillus kokaensis]|uniref:N-(5'-phosphoribosyl)anthranilate isomerase n=1 Tax=Neobacillus kokaensis TaxID=2759023 RepID=A0ABQ3N3Y0_9BACI|nr:phosphoribosylanthranilate isomerase [Neobacillus kokaensis]GHH98347.1 N-(5'-phosphoribosyl)anthranilate isomerase [Neobacillus kokaensis]